MNLEIDSIHTTITKTDKERIKRYGKGNITKGLRVLLDIADKKSILITVNTEFVI